MVDYYVKKGFENMQFDRVMALLKTTYWANERSQAQMQTAMQNSICFGVFLCENDLQAGFARVITDYATMYYLCDVVIDPDHRGKGMGYELIKAIEENKETCGFRGILLTRDAHGLYEKFGYGTCENRAMVKPVLDR
jgi:N-acetylglutamate synthase-like GNAT family acetyltransferase